MSDRELYKSRDFSLGMMHEFAGAFGRAGGTPEMIQLATESSAGMARVVETFRELILPYADEVVESSFDYPEGFCIRKAEEQAERLYAEFPELDITYVMQLAGGELPAGAEGWGVIPKPSKIAGSYHGALARAIELLSAERGGKFKNWREGALTARKLGLLEKTYKVLAKLEAETPGDYLVIPFQFGKKWRGRSVRHSQVRFAENEFGLGPYEVAMLLLTHPDRLTGSGQLYINCGGCKYRLEVSKRAFPFCIYFDWDSYDKQLGLYHSSTVSANAQWGSASGFASPFDLAQGAQ